MNDLTFMFVAHEILWVVIVVIAWKTGWYSGGAAAYREATEHIKNLRKALAREKDGNRDNSTSK